MDALINLLILYIIFTLFSSLFRKTTSSKQAPKQQKPSTQPQILVENIQTRVGQYTRKIEQYLTQAAPSEQPPPFAVTQESVPVSDRIEPATELILSSTDQELEQLLSLPPEDITQNILPLSQQQTRISMAKKTGQAESLLNLFTNRQSVLQGIILSEILGPPLSKRSQR
ncbi:hypothetical protein U27_01498 [Candidatus Vecturithrix granuli]|uniref:Uncharacterized protein n=1 Tax=Vecturithrix granuli TaxID=1499967 RepID=A0A081CAJ2_VECG1|nr:hypothetical protein U27_01498 [Candidatus Vecturithrix granuli]